MHLEKTIFHKSSQDKKALPGVTDQLEVGDSNGALLIHVLLVFVLYQTLHQVPRVYLVICHILKRQCAFTLHL